VSLISSQSYESTSLKARADGLRRALLSVAAASRARGALFPSQRRLSVALGICHVTVWRHTLRLVEAGDITVSQGRNGRLRVDAVRPGRAGQ